MTTPETKPTVASLLFPPWTFALFGLMNVVLSFFQDSGDARVYRISFGVMCVAASYQMRVIEQFAAALTERRKVSS